MGPLPSRAATGAVTVAGAVDYEATPVVNLTLQASDGGHTDTVTVKVTVTDVDEPPVFTKETYDASIKEQLPHFTDVTTVTATDPEGAAVTYSITGGDTPHSFNIDYNHGFILTTRELDFENKSSYSLTVEARDATGNKATATVAVSVLNVGEVPPPAPTGLSASLSAGDISLSWDAVTDAEDYRVQYRTGTNAWTNLEPTTETSDTVSGLMCGQTFEFQVQARGDGVEFTTAWGAASASVSQVSAACTADPVFGSESYGFTVAENAALGTAVGTVSATDADGNTLTYSITAGNSAGHFALGTDNGSLTVAAAMDYETFVAYVLTVTVEDGTGRSDTAAVRVEVTDVAETGPPVPQRLTTGLVGTTIGISWDALTGADQYRVQYRIGGVAGEWVNLEAQTATNASLTMQECGTTYEVRVQAHGDGTTHPAVWGSRTGHVLYNSFACPAPARPVTSWLRPRQPP